MLKMSPAQPGSASNTTASSTPSHSAIQEQPSPPATMGHLSRTLHFITLLGLGSRLSKRKVGDEYIKCPSTIGVRLLSDIDIVVPVIDVLKNKDSGIEPADISSRVVRSDEFFDLNMYELMYLVIRDEYGGYLCRDGDPRGVYFAPKMQGYLKGEAKLPTPALIFKPRTGAIKEDMLEIDEEFNGIWRVKPEFADRFGALFEEKGVINTKSGISRVELMALALQDMLRLKALG